MEPNVIARLMKHPGLAIIIIKRACEYALQVPTYLFWSLVGLAQPRGPAPAIIDGQSGVATPVDSFWGRHTVVGFQLAIARTAAQSKQYVGWRSEQYPLFEDLMGLWGDHRGQTILDYGCGPGTDLVGFLLNGQAKQVVGIDISAKALSFASRRLALHHIAPDRVKLFHIKDSVPQIPLPDNSVDYVYSLGVLHHTSNPEAILKELYRVLRPGGEGGVMIYNQDSLYFHLYVAYELMVLQGKYQGMKALDAFTHTTDTDSCPLARCYTPEAFTDLCRAAGFRVQYMGGYFSKLELALLKSLQQQAILDERLSTEHTRFLLDLKPDHSTHGYPMYRGWYAGVGGTYRLRKV